MRTHDTILLEQAYTQIRNVEEAKMRDLVASAAMGLAATQGAHATPTAHETSAPVAHQEEGETSWHKAKVAYDKAIANPKIRPSKEDLQTIAGNEEYARNYIEFLILNGHEVPSVVKQGAPTTAAAWEKAKEAPYKESADPDKAKHESAVAKLKQDGYKIKEIKDGHVTLSKKLNDETVREITVDPKGEHIKYTKA